MDIASLAGLIAGISFVAIGILLDGSLDSFYDFPSVMITLGGTLAATLVAYPLKKIIKLTGVCKVVFSNNNLNSLKVISDITTLANTARKEGLLYLEEAAGQLDDSFLQRGIMLIVDGTDPELVRSIMETELNFIEERHKEWQGMLEAMGSYAPAYGMIGTLIGLVNMLKNLNDVASLGPSMSVALVTTFYGSMLANLVFLPMANKLKIKSSEEILYKEIIVEGILSIQAGENPRIIEEKLKVFLPPQERMIQSKTAEGAVVSE